MGPEEAGVQETSHPCGQDGLRKLCVTGPSPLAIGRARTTDSERDRPILERGCSRETRSYPRLGHPLKQL